MTAKRRKTAQINLKVMPELKEAAERAAAADQRTLTSFIEKLLTDHCRATGHLPPEPPLPATRRGKAR